MSIACVRADDLVMQDILTDNRLRQQQIKEGIFWLYCCILFLFLGVCMPVCTQDTLADQPHTAKKEL